MDLKKKKVKTGISFGHDSVVSSYVESERSQV